MKTTYIEVPDLLRDIIIEGNATNVNFIGVRYADDLYDDITVRMHFTRVIHVETVPTLLRFDNHDGEAIEFTNVKKIIKKVYRDRKEYEVLICGESQHEKSYIFETKKS